MDDSQLERYSRHTVLAQIGREGQQRLLGSRALIIGLGGLGSPIAMYLAASGVGTLVLVDYDVVELSNLQRQIIHHTADVGRLKVECAAERLRALNPGVRVLTIARALDGADLALEVGAADVVLDATDNFESRFALNAACVRARKPLVSAAAQRMEAQVCVFDLRRPESPCYRCLYPDVSGEGEVCAQTGVLAPMLGIVGSVQATEALKLLLETGTALTGRMLMLDALSMEWRSLKLPKDPNCPACAPQGATTATDTQIS